MRRFVIMAVLCLSAAPALVAQEKALGFIVKAEETRFYKSAETDEVLATLPEGEAVAGYVTGMFGAKDTKGQSGNWSRQEKNGRVHVLRLQPPNERGMILWQPGWVVEADVQAFSYNCGCGPKESWPQEADPCSPLLAANGLRTTKYEWNICFKEGRDAKLAAAPAAAPAPAAAAAAPAATVEERLAKLEELFKKGIITKEEYDAKRADILKEL